MTASPGSPLGRAWWAVPGALVGIVLAGLGASIGYALTNSKTSAASDLLGEAGLWVAMLGTAVFVSRRFGTGSLARDYRLAIRPKDLVWGVIAVIGALVVVQGVLGVFAGTKFAGSNDEILTQQKGNSVGLVIVALLVALGAPFFEELFFRGFLRTTLQRRFGGHGAVWLQAVFFGMAHFGEAANVGGQCISGAGHVRCGGRARLRSEADGPSGRGHDRSLPVQPAGGGIGPMRGS